LQNKNVSQEEKEKSLKKEQDTNLLNKKTKQIEPLIQEKQIKKAKIEEKKVGKFLYMKNNRNY
jgi:hypothetical protein